jgi:hypothetical protein
MEAARRSPCPLSTGATTLRSLTATHPRFAQAYTSFIRLFFACSAAINFVAMGTDRTHAYAKALSPTQPTYVQIEDASRRGKELKQLVGTISAQGLAQTR